MKIGIVHLTDLHFTAKTQLEKKTESFCNILTNDFFGIDALYFVISGDIAATGNKIEYENVKKYLTEIFTRISFKEKIGVIMVPGNHDCNFEYDNQLRKNSIKDVDYETLGDDDSVLTNCLVVQQDFWEFYNNYNSQPTNKLFYNINEKIGDFNIRFNCFNTAWMSSKEEKPGTLFFPVKSISDVSNDIDISISVIHHPTNWFTPETEENNKRAFEKFLTKYSTIQLIGHEHVTGVVRKNDLDDEISSLQFSGKIFNNNDRPKESGFQLLTIDLAKRNGAISKYSWEENLYVKNNTKDFELNHVKEKEFNFSKPFSEYLNKISIPLAEMNDRLRLSDIFIFPHLESIEIDQKFMDSFIDSESIILNTDINHWILEGDSQSGKTSLLRMICLESYNIGHYPILIKGEEIRSLEIEKLLKDKFKKTYTSSLNDYDRFVQLDKKKKIVIIDDFHHTKLTTLETKLIVEKLCQRFGKVIITIDSVRHMFNQVNSEFDTFKSFTIKPLGYKKTNDLIVKYQSLNQNELTEKQVFLSQVKYKFDQVRIIVGNRIIPSYPIFLLSIFQSLDNASLDLSNTSYGHCYQSLIHFALVNQAKVKNEDIDSYINFLKRFAFYLHKKDTDCVSEDDFMQFYNDYKQEFHFFSYQTIRQKLLSSKILVEDDSCMKFGYKYILLFLAAKHISDILNTHEGKEILSKMFENFHLEKNANILVFITHHTNDLSFMHDSLFHALVPFENVNPITLDRKDPYYSHLAEISKSISDDVIEQINTPEEERDIQLTSQDQNQRYIEKKNDNFNPVEVKEASIPFLQAFAAINIIGQIVKNRKGSLTKRKIVELITEAYCTGFRTVGFVGNLLADAKEALVDEHANRINRNDSKKDIEEKITQFIHVLSLNTCLGVFTRLIFAVGIKDFKELYEEVAREIDTPAAKLVSFSINSYHNELSFSEVRDLVKEMKDNPVAMAIIRQRVRNYIYTNHVKYNEKQCLAQLLDMKISSVMGMNINNIN